MTVSLQNKKGGFTLVETLVAILIFSSSIVALLTATSGGLSEVTLLRNKLTANYLAQEGIEQVRNVRDQSVAVLGTGGWQSFITNTSTCQNSTGCVFSAFPSISPNPPTIFSCGTPPSDPCELVVDSLSGLYAPSVPGTIPNPVSSPIRRQIVITPSSATEEAKITVTVSWNQGVSSPQVILEEYLYNW